MIRLHTLLLAPVILFMATPSIAVDNSKECKKLRSELAKDEKALAKAEKDVAAFLKKHPLPHNRDTAMKLTVVKSGVALERKHIELTKADLAKAGC